MKITSNGKHVTIDMEGDIVVSKRGTPSISIDIATVILKNGYFLQGLKGVTKHAELLKEFHRYKDGKTGLNVIAE